MAVPSFETLQSYIGIRASVNALTLPEIPHAKTPSGLLIAHNREHALSPADPLRSPVRIPLLARALLATTPALLHPSGQSLLRRPPRRQLRPPRPRPQDRRRDRRRRWHDHR